MSPATLWVFLWLPLVTAVVTMVGSRSVRGTAAALGTLALAGASFLLLITVEDATPLSVRASSLPAPFAISLLADKLTAIMLALTAFLALISTVYAFFEPRRESGHPYFFPLFQFLLLGLNGVFLAADLFNLYVWFEVLLIASFGLLVLNRVRGRMEGAVKYLTLSLISSTLLLIAAGSLYAMTGTLNLAAMANKVEQLHQPGALNSVAVLLLLAFGIKSAIFPLYFWLPATYHTLPASVAAFFSGIMTKVGLYAIIRMFTLVFPGFLENHAAVILTLAALTMLSGVLGAIAQGDIRRLLSFHIISQIGYILMGVGLAGAAGLAAGIFFLVHVALVKSALFFVTGATERMLHSTALEEMGGVAAASPWVSACFLLGALSLAGFPPFSGFWGKLLVLRAGFEADRYLLTATALLVSLLTLYSMSKIWLAAFWKPYPAGTPLASPRAADWFPVGTLTATTLLLGVFAGPGIQLATRTAAELLSRQPYLRAALGGP